MGSGAVKSIVLLMVLVVLSFLVGAQVSDGVKNSMGAFAIIALVCGLFAMLWMGVNSWRIIFLLPPFISLLPISLLGLPSSFLIATAVLIYWLVMRIMGYARFTWRGHLVLDSLIGGIYIYMIISFYRNPVVLNVMDSDYEYIGGKEYVVAAFSLIYYVTLSCIPIKYEELIKCLKWYFWITFVFSIIWAFYGVLNPQTAYAAGGGEDADAADVFQKGRFAYFQTVGSSILVWLYARYRFGAICTSVWKLSVGIFGVAAVLISGWRTRMVILGMNLAWLAAVKRELLPCILAGGFAYAGLMALGANGALENAPFGMQRVCSALPGVYVSNEAQSDADGSTDVRVRMWRNALDPRTGLIKDYIWGDGFRMSRGMWQRAQTADIRGVFRDQQKYMEMNGAWHNGWVTYLHRLGIVGLVLLQVMMLVAVGVMWQVCRALIGERHAEYAIAPLLELLPPALGSWFLVWTVWEVFRVYTCIVLIKVLYVLLAEKGKIRPFFSRKQYVPLMIRETESGYTLV